MANRPIAQESMTETQSTPVVHVRTASGSVPVEDGIGDTVLHLKQRLCASHGYEISNQCFTFSRGIPSDPIEEVGDERLVQEFATRGTLRVQVTEASQPQNTHYNIHNNHIGTATASGNAQIRSGDEWSMQAIEAMLLSRTGRLPLANSTINNATAEGFAKVISGTLLGPEQANNDRDGNQEQGKQADREKNNM